MPPPISSSRSSSPSVRSNETAEAIAAPPKPAEKPQADWTKTIANPEQQSAARGRHAAAVANPQADSIRAQNEQAEMSLIGGKNQPGVLVGQGGNVKRGTTITIHGINDNPASVLPLGDKTKGGATATFAWDDRSRRLSDSANDFATEVKKTLDANPKAPLTINAYSMGGRVAAVAMHRLEQTGALHNKDVKLNLVAPPLQGFASANMAGMGAAFAPSLRSSQDMGTRSAFQKELESVRFKDVKVQVLGGAADTTAVVDDKWSEIARNLSAQAPTILPGATHDSSVDAAVKKLR